MLTRAVLFDGYGTLYHAPNLDKEGIHLLRALYRHHHAHHPDHKSIAHLLMQKALTHDGNFLEIIAQSSPDLRDQISEYTKNIPRLVSQVSVYPDTIPLLTQLKQNGYKIGLVSDSTTRTKPDLQLLGLDSLIDCAVWSYSCHSAKPDANIFIQTLTQLGVTNNNAVMIGDSIHKDMVGAHNARIRGILLNRRPTNPQYDGDIITSLAQLPNYLN